MTLGSAFWIIMLISLIFGLWSNLPSGNPANPKSVFRPLGSMLLIFVLLTLLGWAQFGAPLHR